MIVAHLSDLHLGYQAYDAVKLGRNVRSLDVEQAFLVAIHEVIKLEADLVVLAGDLLDQATPESSAMVALTRGVRLLRENLPETPVVAVAGARDTPLLRSDPGILSAMDGFPGVEVATSAPRALVFGEMGVRVQLLPNRAIRRAPFPLVRPDPEAKHNILVLHGRLETGGGLAIPEEGWSYVALGHSHTHRRIGERIAYSGSLERVTSDPWSEALEEKGFIAFHLEDAAMEFHAVPGRPVVELAPVRFDPQAPEDVNRRVRDTVAVVPGGIDGKLVKLRILDLPASDIGALDAGMMEELKERALHLQVEFEGGGVEVIHLSAGEAGGMDEWIRAAARTTDVPDELVDRVEDAIRALASAGAPYSKDPHPLLELLEGRSGIISLLRGQGVTGPLPSPRFLSAPPEPSPGLSGFPWEVWGSSITGAGSPDQREGGALGRVAVKAVSRARGSWALEALISALHKDPEGEESWGLERLEREIRRLESRVLEVEAAARLIPSWEADLRELRAESAVVSGDLDEAVAEWLREKQDAETQLMVYRDRARELKGRLTEVETAGPDTDCPTCGRPLEEHTEDVALTLREEWESVVQDGQWWKRRLEQLEPKPDSIQEVESRERELLAGVEELAERIEGARVGQQDLAGLKSRLELLQERADTLARERDLEGPPRSGGLPGDADAEGMPPDPALVALQGEEEEALRLVSWALALLEESVRGELEVRASGLVNRLSGGRIIAVHLEGATVALVSPEGASDARGTREGVLTALALRLAAAWALEQGGYADGKVFEVGAELRWLPPDIQSAAIRALRKLSRAGVPVVVHSDGQVVATHPEAFDALVYQPPDSDRPPRLIPAGAPVFHLHSGAARRRRSASAS